MTVLEIIDFGYPQNTDINSLKTYITTNEFRSEDDIVNFHISVV